MGFSPISSSNEITNKYKRYLSTIFEIADEDYAWQFQKELNKKNAYAKGPYLDIVDAFQKGKSLEELITEGVLPETFKKLGFPMQRLLYLHQEQAIRKSLSRHNIVVSTGTGSGKTESFLIPILSELSREHEAGTLSCGVRALIIYPMNALANDQMERLREILGDYPEITYGSYTGQAKQSYKSALQEYLALNSGRRPKCNELISRDEQIKNPPHILITNYAMLEYLLLRPSENVFFSGRFAEHWKYIVLDEAHVYSGSTGIEVSMLLRRLKSILPVKDVQYILTSATLGDEKQNDEVVEFAVRLCNSVFSGKSIIRATRIDLVQDKKNTQLRAIEDYHQLTRLIDSENEQQLREAVYSLGKKEVYADTHLAVYNLVIEDENYWQLRSLLLEGAYTVRELAEKLQCTEQQLEDFVTVAAYGINEGAQLLDAKYHMFIKACDSAFITLGNSKKLFLTRSKQFNAGGKEYAVFEIAVCSFCHKIYLIGHVDSGNYFQQSSKMQDEQKREILYLGNEISDEDDENSLKKAKIIVEQYKICSRCGKLMRKGAGVGERCEHPEADYVDVFRVSQTDTLTKCVACENINTRGVLRQFFAGQEAVTSVIGTSLYEQLPSTTTIKAEVQNDETEDDFGFSVSSQSKEEVITKKHAKQFIAFSDSRQAAAFYASYFAKTYTTILYKRLIVHTLKNTHFEGNIDQFAGRLQAVFEQFNVVDSEDLLAKNEAWKAILNEMVSSNSANALMNLGLLKFSINQGQIPPNTILKLTAEEMTDVCNIFLQMMMTEGAIHYSIPLNQQDKEFFTNNGHEGAFTLSGSDTTKYHAFIPAKTNYMNRRIDYMMKILAAVSLEYSYDWIVKFLEVLWQRILTNTELQLLACKNGAYKVNTKKIQVYSAAKFYHCSSCKKITPYNVRSICPTFKCNGQLSEINLSEALKDNHYYRMYQDLEIRNLHIVEHTAQLAKEKAYDYQKKFKNKEIDILSCSTTFEMGVDVGSLETVFMRNMPPSPANYAQRAGRAGRSLKSVAYALTFCNKGNHDFSYFKDPETMIRGVIKPPVFKIENEKISIRHIFAAAFGFFWRKYPQYFKDVQTLLENQEGESGIQKLEAYLYGCPENLKDYLADFLPAALVKRYEVHSYGWVVNLLGEEGLLTKAVEGYQYEISLLKISRERALEEGKSVDYIQHRIKNYQKENILSFLSKKSVLPKYGFPVDTVELAIWNRDTKGKLEIDLQRDLAMAISEYAPDSEVVADGNLITSRYIKKVPNIGWKMYDYIYCDCRTLNINPHTDNNGLGTLKECRVCGNGLEEEHKRTFIIPEFGFGAGKIAKAGLIKPKRTFNTEVSYVGYRSDIQSKDVVTEHYHYKLLYSQNDEMAVLNKSNFYVCKSCGYTHLNKNKFQRVLQEKHKMPSGFFCENERLERYSLGYKFDTDVIQIHFCSPFLNQYGEAISVLFAIMKGASSYLNIEESDIAGCLRRFTNPYVQQDSFAIILYDKTPGGAGHVKRLNDDGVLELVLKKTYRMISECDCGGEFKDTSCYNCLRSYSNQYAHDLLQRRYVLGFLADFFTYQK